MTSPEAIQTIRDVAITLSAATTAAAALWGVNVWRRQLVGTQHHRVAVELLKAAIRWREALSDVRAPIMMSHEMEPLPEEEAHPLPAGGDSYRNAARGYERRWGRVREAHAQLEASVIDAEIYLGGWARTWFLDLVATERRLRHAVEEFLASSLYPDRVPRREYQRVVDRDAILYRGGTPDEFGDAVNQLVETLRSLVKKHVSP